MVNYQEGQYNMDLNTLMFIAGQARPQMLMAPKRPPNAPLGPCYNCSGDHLIKDCPYPRQLRQGNVSSLVPSLTRYYLDCGIKHLVIVRSILKKGKATLNIVETIQQVRMKTRK